MWMLVILFAALAASAAWWQMGAQGKKYKLGLLALMLWGAFIMVLVDKTMAWMGGTPFVGWETDGQMARDVLQGLAMLLPVLLIWLAALHAGRTEKKK